MNKFEIAHLYFNKIILLVFSLAISHNVIAKTTEIKPFVKGSFQQIQLQQDTSHKDKPYIIIFWSQTCAFCMEELALLGELLKTYSDVELISITTDPFLNKKSINQILSSKNLLQAQKWVFADNHVKHLYLDVDEKWRGELPLTFFVDRNHKIHKHKGTINKHNLIEWFEQQKRASEKEVI